MRNGYLMAIAPTSSISILVGTTQAIEPIYRKKWFEENLSGLIPVVAQSSLNRILKVTSIRQAKENMVSMEKRQSLRSNVCPN